MKHSMDKTVRATRFAIADFQKRVAVLDATREDLQRQMHKLNESVPEMTVAADAVRDGYVAYGSYANSVIARKENIQNTMNDIDVQNKDLGEELRMAMEALDSFERVRARQLAAKAEKTAAKAAKYA